jgi:hypothetical protein
MRFFRGNDGSSTDVLPEPPAPVTSSGPLFGKLISTSRTRDVPRTRNEARRICRVGNFSAVELNARVIGIGSSVLHLW